MKKWNSQLINIAHDATDVRITHARRNELAALWGPLAHDMFIGDAKTFLSQPMIHQEDTVHHISWVEDSQISGLSRCQSFRVR